jgi:5-methylcytosine-specific restriction endonuclease McrA
MHKLYNHLWRQKRAAFLKKNPLCVFCAARGRTAEATVVDHITPHKGDEALFWNQANWQPLCKPCHDIDKARLERGRGNIGCDVHGNLIGREW